MRPWTQRLIGVALASALALPVHAAAPRANDDAQARRLFEAGSLAYDKGRYADASRAFGEAYRLYARPAIGFSWAQALRRQYFVDGDREHLTTAEGLLRAYVQEVQEGRRRADAVDQLQAIAVLLAAAAPDAARVDPEPAPETPPPETPPPDDPRPTELVVYTDIAGAEASVDGATFTPVPLIVATTPGPHRVQVRAPGYTPARSTETAVQGRIIPVQATLTPIPAALTIHAIPGARVVLDGRELGFAPLDGPVPTQPGAHRVSVTAPGRVDFSASVLAQRGDRVVLDAQTAHTVQRRVAWGLLGGSAGLGVGGGITMGLAFHVQARARDLDDQRQEANLSPQQLEDYNTALDRRDGLRAATIGLLSTAVVAGVSGLILVLTDRPGRRRTRSARVAG